MGSLKFRKSERLTSKKAMDLLFKKGASNLSFPIKIIHLTHPEPSAKGHQVLISVPIRHFKNATDRNTLKRRIREGYRLNKALLKSTPALCVAYIYVAKEILTSSVIHQAVKTTLEQLLNTYEKKS